ncbi:MAG: MFS transporter [Candidatus Dormibacteria bacterium]
MSPLNRLTALRSRNFRIFWFAQLGSVSGSWMQSVAQAWLVWQLTKSGFWLGFVVALQFIPGLLLAPIGGWIADHFPRQRVLLITQGSLIVPSGVLAILTFTGHVSLLAVGVASLVSGIITAIDVPARQAIMPDLAGRENTMSAIALNSSMFNATRIVGATVAALVLGVWGVAVCFAVNSLTYLGPELALLSMRDLPPQTVPPVKLGLWPNIREGFAFARRDRRVGGSLLLVFLYATFTMNFQTLLPIFADHVFNAGAAGLGLLFSAQGVGALASALVLAMERNGHPSGRRAMISALLLSLGLVLFSLPQPFPSALVLIAASGWFQIRLLATCNTRLQLITPDHLRGRVMAIYSQAVLGSGPIGALFAGGLASLFGAPMAMVAGAVIAAVCLAGLGRGLPEAFVRHRHPEAEVAPA